MPGKGERKLSTLVITGSRTEETERTAVVRTRIVTGDELRKGGATSIREALDYLPGLQSYGHGGNSFVQMQGLNNNYVKILVDGIPLTGAILDGLPLENLPISSIERVEMVNGASSSLYGSEAVAGVIQIFTRKTQ
ncbi:MAG: TonB-dependent receptor, partial [Spirochaetia bacterium]|nr:TonB-dependent receptor [Spirochaetia bacterium]